MSAGFFGRAVRSTSATRIRRCSSPIFSTKLARRCSSVPVVSRCSIARSFRTIWLMMAKSSWMSIASRSWTNISSSSSVSSTPPSTTWKMALTSLGKSRVFSSSAISCCSLAFRSSVALSPAITAPRICSTPSSLESRSSALTRAKRRKSSELVWRRA